MYVITKPEINTQCPEACGSNQTIDLKFHESKKRKICTTMTGGNSIETNILKTNLDICQQAISIEDNIVNKLIQIQFLDAKSNHLQQFEDAAINIAIYPECTEGVLIFTLFKMKVELCDAPIYYIRYIESGYYRNVMTETFSDVLCKYLNTSKDFLFVWEIATEEDQQCILDRKVKKGVVRPDKIYNFNLSNLKQRKLQLAENAKKCTDLELFASFIVTMRKGFTVKIGPGTSDHCYMTSDYEIFQNSEISNVIVNYPASRLLNTVKKSSNDFLQPLQPVPCLYDQCIILNMLSNDHVRFLHKGPLRFKYRFSICPAATSLRNKILHLYKNCKFQDLFQLYCDIFVTNEEHNVIEDVNHHGGPVIKQRRLFKPRGKMVTADIVLKTIGNLQNDNFTTDIRLYDNFKKQLVEYGDLAVHGYSQLNMEI